MWIGALARRDVPTCGLETTIREIRALIGEWKTCFVVDADRVVLGRVYLRDLDGPPERRAEAIMRNGPSTFRPDRTAADLYATMQRANLTTAPVTTSDGRLVGVVFRDDLAHALRE